MTSPPPSSYRRKWALITGASPGGMGESHTLSFLKRGINVIATSIDTDDIAYLQPDKNSNDGFLVTLKLDVTSPESISSAVEQVSHLTDGKLDFLLNNAGYGYYCPLLDASITQAKKEYDVNVWGLLACTQAFFPLLREAKGCVVNQASVSGIENFSRPFMGIYSSSKAAVMTLSAAMRVEFAPFDVEVVTLVTASVKTEFFKHKAGAGVPEGSVYGVVKGEVEEVMGTSLASGKGADRFEVAERTIEALLKEQRPVFVREGYRATLQAWVLWLMPVWWTDSRNVASTPLGKLRGLLAGEGGEGKEA